MDAMRPRRTVERRILLALRMVLDMWIRCVALIEAFDRVVGL